ncbi:hypothetical protein [Burkholderia stagnalis]|uniref:hypothetical protein n=1 Tax=Burkholderia stagnalis TaxID=1503054 RepID=UPI000F5DC958|nr:hypothetical protein [Burkholderia stagnalis]
MEIQQASAWQPVVRRGLVVASASSLESYYNQTSELPEFVHAPSKTAVKERLRNRLVRNDPELWKASPETKVQALVDFDKGYLPTEEALRFTVSLVASYVDCMRSKDIHNPRYRRYFYSFKEALQGRGPVPSRESLETLTGVSYILAGSVHQCRTTYIQRLRNLFGEPFRVEGPSLNDINAVWYFPIVVLRWPTCGTLKGLLEQFRDRLVSELKDPADTGPILKRVRGRNAPSALIAASVLLNVGMLVVDGALAESLGGELRDILAFLGDLQSYANIPVLLSCSDAFLNGAEKLGSKVENVLRGRMLVFEPLARPAAGASKRGLWHQHNQWLWSAGLLPPMLEMPCNLPSWTWEICLGRVDWLVDGFRALHERLAWEPSLLINGGPSRDVVVEAFKHRLRILTAPRSFIEEYDNKSKSLQRKDLLQHVDYLPFNDIAELLDVRQRPARLGVEYA